MLDDTKNHLAAQLQTIIRMHLRHYDIDIPQLATIMDVTEWAVTGMLNTNRWHLDLCLTLIDRLNITLSISDTSIA